MLTFCEHLLQRNNEFFKFCGTNMDIYSKTANSQLLGFALSINIYACKIHPDFCYFSTDKHLN